jgi:GR25 family glycosyltransferase involved in LPS biosynthesis
MSNPFDYFDAIYCINLDERPDRWEHCVKQFEILGIADRVKRFSAIKPIHDERWHRPTPWGKGKYAYPLRGAVGCAESHKALITIAKEQNLKNIMVFEDDFVVLENWKENLANSISELQNHRWHNFYLGYHLQRVGVRMEIKHGEHLSRCVAKKHRGIQLTTALAYNSTIFDYLIKNINSFNHRECGREGHVDKYYASNRKIMKYFAKPEIVTQNHDLGSDIQ